MRHITGKILNGIGRCKNCNKKIFIQGYDPNHRVTRLMDSEKLCYDCAYWKDLSKNPPPNLEVVGKQCLQIFPEIKEKDNSMLLGNKGRVRYFMRPNLETIRSNDVWLIGTIPDRFIDLFPITLHEIKRHLFLALQNSTRRCQAIGCMDRYHCLRFRIELECGDNKPYNTVPSTWKIGDEHCRYFLNKKNIISDQRNVK